MNKIVIAFLLISMVFNAYFVLNKTDLLNTNVKKLEAKNISDLLNAIFIIKQMYYKDISKEELINLSLEGLVENLSQERFVINEVELSSYSPSKIANSGLVLTKHDNKVTVISTFKDSPSSLSGVMAGDIITHINNKPTLNMNYSDLQKELQGNTQSLLNIKVLRNAKVLQFDIVKKNYQIEALETKLLNDVAYIKINYFSLGVSNQLITYIKDISQNNNANYIIMDLRNNSGGYIQEAINIADALLEGSPIAYIQQNKQKPYLVQASNNDISNGIPIFIIINSGTASSAELLAGALQKTKRAAIIGSDSFGKSTIQTIVKINDNNSYIKLTTGVFFFDSLNINENQIIYPDIYYNQLKCNKSCNLSDQYQSINKVLSTIFNN